MLPYVCYMYANCVVFDGGGLWSSKHPLLYTQIHNNDMKGLEEKITCFSEAMSLSYLFEKLRNECK